MKMLPIILVMLSLSVIAVHQWHSYSKATITEISVMQDSTDTLLSEVSADEIFRQFKLFDKNNDNDWDGAIFRYQTINDVSYNKVIEVSLQPENFWLGNDIDRKKKIEEFRADLFKPFKEKGVGGNKSNSSVYLPIARELTHLSESASTIKKLLVYSDFMENTYDLSFYNEETLAMLQSHPDIMIKTLQERLPLPSLIGIEIHLIYQPDKTETDRVFRIVSTFYVKMLERKGAKVIVEANI